MKSAPVSGGASREGTGTTGGGQTNSAHPSDSVAINVTLTLINMHVYQWPVVTQAGLAAR